MPRDTGRSETSGYGVWDSVSIDVSSPMASCFTRMPSWRTSRRPSTDHLEEIRYRNWSTGGKALRLEVCGPRGQVFRECRIGIRVPVIQVGAITPAGRVGTKRIQQCYSDSPAQIALIGICFQSRDGFRKPLGKTISADPRTSCRDALGVRVVIRCESGSIGNGLWWLRSPELGQTMQHEQRREFAEALVEPSVLVSPVAIEAGHDVGELVVRTGTRTGSSTCPVR